MRAVVRLDSLQLCQKGHVSQQASNQQLLRDTLVNMQRASSAPAAEQQLRPTAWHPHTKTHSLSLSSHSLTHNNPTQQSTRPSTTTLTRRSQGCTSTLTTCSPL